MSTLVTAAAGFVGRAFVHALHTRGAEVRTLIRSDAKRVAVAGTDVFLGDLLDRDAVRAAVRGVDTVVHVPPRSLPAGGGFTDLASCRQAQVDTTRLVLEESVLAGVERLLFISTAHATGRSRTDPLCEKAPAQPQTPYARAKLEAEALIGSYVERHDLRAVIVRPPGIYGAGDKSMVSSLLRAANRGLWLPLKGVRAQHSLVFVDNLATAGLALLDRAPATERAFIVKDPVDYSAADIYAAACVSLGTEVRLFALPDFLLRALETMDPRYHGLPGFRSFALLHHLLTPQRYCAHLFREVLPSFRFVALESALHTMLHGAPFFHPV